MPKSIHRPEYAIVRRHLRELRLRAGWTQEELSSELGRSQSFVSDVERGTRRVDIIEVRDICVLLGQSLTEFFQAIETEIAALSSRKRR